MELDGVLVAIAWAAGICLSVDGLLELRFRDRWLPLLAITTFVLLRRFPLLIHLRPHLNGGLLLTLAWVVLSLGWSPNPGATFTQAAAIVGVFLIGAAFGLAGWSALRFIDVLSITVTALLALSLVVGLAFPDIGIHQESNFELAGSWRGGTYQKNALGQLAAIGMIVWTYRWAARLSSLGAAAGGVALSLLMLVNSRSSTSLMLSLLACATVLVLLRPAIDLGATLRRGALLAVTLMVPLGIFLAVRTSFFAPIGAWFGKDGTFSGRTLIWEQMYIDIAQHPWLGIGYASFWQAPATASLRIKELLQWDVPSGHNGYLDVINELGFIGFALFLIFIGLHYRALLRLAHVDRMAFAFHLPLFLYVLLANVSESGWFRPVELTHLLTMYSSAEISRRLFAHALLRPAPGTPLRGMQEATRPGDVQALSRPRS
jgi:exopolysaccharide production protein ExoQ